MSNEDEYGFTSDPIEVCKGGLKVTVYTPKIFPDVCGQCRKSMMDVPDRKLEGFLPAYFCSDDCRTKYQDERESMMKWMEETNFVEKLQAELVKIAEKYPLIPRETSSGKEGEE